MISDHDTPPPASPDDSEQPGTWGIDDTARMTGITPANLRLWEKRYGWPRPERDAEGSRLFTAQQIEDLKRMADLLGSGHRIGELIADGKPLWPTGPIASPEHPPFDFKDIPQPGTPTAKWIRGQLEEALKQNDEGVINWAKAQAHTFRPEDRERAVFALLAKAGRLEGRPVAQSAPVPDPPPQADMAPTMAADPAEDTLSGTRQGDVVQAEAATPSQETGGNEVVEEKEVEVEEEQEKEEEEGEEGKEGKEGKEETGSPPITPPVAVADLKAAIERKLAETGLDLAAAAREIGVSPMTLGNIVNKGSRPNARTVGRFVAWVQQPVALRAVSRPERRDTATPPVPRRSRRPRTGAAASRRPPPGPSLPEVLRIVRAAIERNGAAARRQHPIDADPLAKRVHGASAELRAIITGLFALEREAGRLKRR